jgi:hypothetical protein
MSCNNLRSRVPGPRVVCASRVVRLPTWARSQSVRSWSPLPASRSSPASRCASWTGRESPCGSAGSTTTPGPAGRMQFRCRIDFSRTRQSVSSNDNIADLSSLNLQKGSLNETEKMGLAPVFGCPEALIGSDARRVRHYPEFRTIQGNRFAKLCFEGIWLEILGIDAVQ